MGRGSTEIEDRAEEEEGEEEDLTRDQEDPEVMPLQLINPKLFEVII